MKARYYILAIAIIGFFIVLSLPNYQITIEKVNNKLISFVSGAGEEPWTIEGDSVYIDDVNILLNITPHTSNQPIIKLMTKTYSGEIDLVVGFNTTQVTPKKAEYNPQLVDVEKSYTCNYEFNYTTDPNYFWCYQTILTYDNITNTTNGSYTNVVFEHSFLTGDIPTKTAYWTEVEEVWTDVSGAFTPVNVDYLGYNKWYYIQGFEINALQEYQLRLTLQSKSINDPSYKYFFGVKPSSETLQEAIDLGHFYFIDPWTEALSVDLVSYWKMDEQDTTGTGTIEDSLNINDGVNDQADNATGRINTAYNFGGTGERIDWADYAVADGDFSIGMWIKWDDIARASYAGYGFILTSYQDPTNNAFIHLYTSSSAVVFRMRDNTASGITSVTSGTLSNDNWYYIMMTYDAGTKAMKLYTNTTTPYSGTFGGGSFSLIDTTLIGSNANSANPFSGTLDEFSIWNRTLNATEVGELILGISWEGIVTEDCVFNGTVKDGDGNAINGARIVINYAESDSFFGNATSDASGLWNLNVTADGNYTVYAYEPGNITRPSDSRSYRECIRV